MYFTNIMNLGSLKEIQKCKDQNRNGLKYFNAYIKHIT